MSYCLKNLKDSTSHTKYKGKENESKIISKENLRQMQMYQKKRQNCRNLRKS